MSRSRSSSQVYLPNELPQLGFDLPSTDDESRPLAAPGDWDGAASAVDPLETVSEAAARILFADTLEEKLRLFSPAAPLGSSPASLLPPPSQAFRPGRPTELRFASRQIEKAPLPASPALIDEGERGRLLHFFANHELLAAELMALALLRFPDSPEPFRRGLARTLLEELRHTRWYLARMKTCGVAFGQHPANGFFWNAVASMEAPIDYVSRLSLTFEQANLDYSRHYAGLLHDAGDHASAAILHRIYRDEISHVGYGLHWFRRWKQPGLSDWEEHERRLVFPLSLRRARGNRAAFNKEGRLAAGFDEDYLARLELYERSTGRVPDVHFFNPEAEALAAASPRRHTPGRALATLAGDLELLQAFVARRDDVVLLRREPSPEHLRCLKDHGLTLPELETLDPGGGIAAGSLLRERKLRRLVPWSAAPDLERRFAPVAARCDEPSSLTWHPGWRALFSKNDQCEALAPWFGESFPIRSESDLAAALERLAAREASSHRDPGPEQEAPGGLLIKRPFSAAGRGLRRVSFAQLRHLAPSLFSERSAREGGFLLEPWHQRVFDFSAQYHVSSDGVRLLGFAEQRLGPGGAYRGSLAMPRFCHGLPRETARLLATEALPRYDPEGPLVEDLRRWTAALGYEGPLGIDTYLYHEDGVLKHRPVCEVNARHTMGRVALELRRRVAAGHGALLEIVSLAQLKAGANVSAKTCSESTRSEMPQMPQTSEMQDGRLCGGSLLLTPPGTAQRFVARLRVAKRRSEFELDL